MKKDMGDWQQFDNLLCVRLDNIGDVLMSTPAIRALKEARPGRRITLLTSSNGAQIARHVPDIDDVIVFDPPWYRHPSIAGNDGVAATAEQLRAQQFDAAVILTVFSQNPLPTAMLCYLAAIPRIAGYCRENPYELMSDWIPDDEPLKGVRHEVQRQLDLATALGAVPSQSSLSLRVPVHRSADAREAMHAAGLNPDQPWIALHPGASEKRRRYPLENFAAAARMLHEQLGVQVAITGGGSERELAAAIVSQAGEGVRSLAGMLDIEACIALLDMAPLLISNNTGPVHIAAALGTPVVVAYARTNPQHTPWQVPHRVLAFDVPEPELSRNTMVRYARNRFFRDSRREIEPQDIVDAAADLLGDHMSGWRMSETAFRPPNREALQATTALRPG